MSGSDDTPRTPGPSPRRVAPRPQDREGREMERDVRAHLFGADVSGPTSGTGTQLEQTTSEEEPPAGLARGTLVDRYVLLDRLGAGGMGVVHAAYDPELDRKVALKLLLPSKSGASGQARLLREAQALARLAHPNVVAVYDVGTHDEQVWIGMEFVPGLTLGSWARERPRGWQEALRVLTDVARGVAAAHAVGLVHRDLKPENVMISRDGRVRVMDFGLAHGRSLAAVEQELAATSTTQSPSPVDPTLARTLAPGDELQPEFAALAQRLTQVGSIQGTPAYMAPEQWRGEDATAAADQFGWSVMAWELLYGERPFVGEQVLVLAANTLAGLRRPPRKGLGVPGWLRRTIERGLTTAPGRRWPSMQALLDELARAQGRARRGRVLAGIAGVVAAAGLVAGGTALDRQQRAAACATRGRSIEEVWHADASRRVRDGLLATGAGNASTTADRVTPRLDEWAGTWAEVRERTCVAAELAGTIDAATASRVDECLDERRERLVALVDELARADAGVVQRAVIAAAGLPQVTTCADPIELARRPQLPADRLAEAREIRTALSRAHTLRLAGRYDSGRTVAAEADVRAAALGFAPLAAEAALVEGLLLDAAGDYDDAEAALRRAYVAAGVADAPAVAADAAVALIFVAGFHRARTAEGEVWAQAAEVAVARTEAEPGLRTAMRLDNLGKVRLTQGDAEAARSLLAQSLTLWTAALGPEHVDVAGCMNNLASALYTLGRNVEAEEMHRRALDLRTRTLGADHPLVAASLNNLAAVVRETGRTGEALALQRRALGIREVALGREHPEVATSCFNVAISLRSTMDLQAPGFAVDSVELEQLFRRALEIWEATLGREHPHVTYALIGLAELALDRHDGAGAVAPASRALTIREAGGVAQGLVGEARFVLAQALVESGGDHGRAHALAVQALADLRADGDDPLMLANVEKWLREHPPGREGSTDVGTTRP